MEVILILTAFFVVWLAVIFTAKNSIAYKEFVVNGIKPEIKKLIQNQPQTRKYVRNLNSLQQWKKFSPENYLKSKFTEEWYLVSEIKKDLPIIKKNIADYQSTYSRVYSEFSLKKSGLKWYVSFQIEKDIKKSYQIFSNSNYYNMFEIEWCYTSPKGRNSYKSRNKFTYHQISQMLSKLEENKTSKLDINYQKTKSSSSDSLRISKLDSFNDSNDNSIIDVTGQSTTTTLNLSNKKYGKGVPKWADKNIYSFSEITNATSEQVKFYNFFKKSFANGEIVSLEGNYNYAFILMFDFQNEYEKDKNILKLETRLKKLGNCWPDTKPYGSAILKNKKEEVSIKSSSLNNYKDDSIIDISRQTTKINSKAVLTKFTLGVPEWKNQYVYSFSEINQASESQKGFYNVFKNSFLNGIYYNLHKNTNYVFVLINDFRNEYEEDKNLLKLETQLKTIGEIYPDTKPFGDLILKQKKEEVNIFASNNNNVYPDNNYYEENWKLGDKLKLSLTTSEVNLLNEIWLPNNSFCNIEFCLQEVLKLYISVMSELKNSYKQQGKTIENELLSVADEIARKDFNYQKGSQNYNYCIKKISTDEFYTHVFVKCEKAVRECYGVNVKREINTYQLNSNFTSTTKNIRFHSRITYLVNRLLIQLIPNIAKPNEATVIELHAQNTTRSRVGLKELISNYDIDPIFFIESVIELGKSHNRKSSKENIFLDASKFICKLDKEAAILFYFHYVYYELISSNGNNKKITKMMKENLFKTDVQFNNFQLIVNNLIKDKDLNKAIKKIPEIYKINRARIFIDTDAIKEIPKQDSKTIKYSKENINPIIDKTLEQSIKPASKEDVKLNSQLPFRWRDKFDESKANFEKQNKTIDSEKTSSSKIHQNPEIKRKKLEFDTASINEIQKKHSETVELLNEYLKDDFEDENNSIKSQETSNEEVQIQVIRKSEEVHQSTFLSELTFTAIHTTTLELFEKSNFSISQDEFEVFAKSKGVFKNQLIESINDTCYEFLDDVLIEEEEDYYTINTNYFQRISTK